MAGAEPTSGRIFAGTNRGVGASRFDFWPVETAVGQSAVIGLALDPEERPWAPSVLVEVVASLLALALDRQHVRARRDVPSAG